jgi:aspartyl protease family protein
VVNRLTIVLAFLGIGLAILVFNHDTGQSFGMSNEDFGHLVYLVPIAALLSAGVLAGRRGGLGETLRNLAIWLLIIMALVAGYLYKDDVSRFGARMAAGLMPGSAVVMTTSEGGQEVILHRSMGGHFRARVDVNGKTVPMLVDTGASAVVLSYQDAQALGLKPDSLTYSVRVTTANGQAYAAPVRLDTVSIGPIERRSIRAMVAEKGRLEESLLGMTFLSTLGSIQIQTNELKLRD